MPDFADDVDISRIIQEHELMHSLYADPPSTREIDARVDAIIDNQE